MQYCSCYSNKYNEIKMCDLEPFSEIQSHIYINLANLALAEETSQIG